MADQFVGEVRAVGFNFAASGWAECNGQLLSISQNTALFSLLGTFYGGDGKTTFALPNLQGNVAIGQGQGAGLTARIIGEQSGSSSVTLLTSEIPIHPHTFSGNTDDSPNSSGPANAAYCLSAQTQLYSTATSPLVPMGTLVPAGSSQPHNNMMPFLVMNFIIALQGIYPARS